jgi:hypothetical protein
MPSAPRMPSGLVSPARPAPSSGSGANAAPQPQQDGTGRGRPGDRPPTRRHQPPSGKQQQQKRQQPQHDPPRPLAQPRHGQPARQRARLVDQGVPGVVLAEEGRAEQQPDCAAQPADRVAWPASHDHRPHGRIGPPTQPREHGAADVRGGIVDRPQQEARHHQAPVGRQGGPGDPHGNARRRVGDATPRSPGGRSARTPCHVLSFGVDDHEHCRFCGIVLLPPSLHRVRSDNVTSYVSVSAIAEFVKQPVTCQRVRTRLGRRRR